MPLGDGQPDRVGDALTEGARGHLDPGGDEVLGVPRGHGVQLSEVLEVVHRDAVTVPYVRRQQERGEGEGGGRRSNRKQDRGFSGVGVWGMGCAMVICAKVEFDGR